ncbi:small GTP-binding protein [Histomonas meleagridis]|uniref:small GTP-binding protein n=1 Tax=Histomonas meleagridis TaxID=135588 RepID=UPI00355AA99C|nr:small GTP-binding protein [Histomonas meleagridis]KAH0802225.1 small GTP-binding protein [Histomonas meleagridis]
MGEEPPIINVALVGNSGVGKTAVGTRFVKGAFDFRAIKPNAGCDYMMKEIVFNGLNVIMKICDTAGQEAYRSLAPIYYQKADIIIIVFALGDHNPKIQNSRESFDSVREWFEQVNGYNCDALIALCGSMHDLQKREISYDEAEEKARGLSENGVDYFETSSVTGDGIDGMFYSLAEKFFATRTVNSKSNTVTLEKQNVDSNQKKKIFDCCD